MHRFTFLFICTYVIAAHISFAQTTVTFQPDATCGKDAPVAHLWPDNNYALHNDLIACAWTNGGNPSNCRALVEFDLAVIPAGATILQATLSLYHYPSVSNTGHSTLSGSNACWLERIIQPWGENTVTWNNQPATTAVNSVNVPMSTNNTQNYVLDVTAMTQDMINDPANSHGYMLRLQNENYYRSMLFASSDMSNPALHSKLVVTYAQAIPPAAGCWSSVTNDTNSVVTVTAVSALGPARPTSTTPVVPVPTDWFITMPNVFTPNSDGINDLFFADTSGVVVHEFIVYNRWGNEVFRSSPGAPWNGENSNGKNCSDGTYYYVLSYSARDGMKNILTGFVTLIR